MADLAAIRTKLERRLARLEDRTKRIDADLRKPGNRDWTERATERENDAVLESLGAAELEEIAQIRAALVRLDEGVYGRCTRCGESIQAARLEVVPFTDSCIACETAGESR